MTRTRLLIGVLVVLALAAGLLIGRSSGSGEPAPRATKGEVSTEAEQITLPGLWLGESYRQSVPMLSLTRLPGAKMNGVFYVLMAPPRELAAIEPYTKDRPVGWTAVKTPVGEALVNPKGDTAWIEDPQGNPLRIYSYTGQVRDNLQALRKRPS